MTCDEMGNKIESDETGKSRGEVMLKLDIQKLRLEQARACLTDTELATKAELGVGTLPKIFNKKRVATPKTIGKLAKALDIDVTEIISE
ncbi:helix-turn-helix domain-containing protein [Clostridium chromiireducens]|nr:helix-turn-helix transcriptional regulator [Clostridium chromiireducens]